jgi:hypothetical protein
MSSKDKTALNKVFQRGGKGEGALSVIGKNATTKASSPKKRQSHRYSDEGEDDVDEASEGVGSIVSDDERASFIQTT